MPKYNPEARAPQMQLINGDYPFEIVKVENLISQGVKTRGCDQRKVHLDVFQDTTFKVKIAEVNDLLIDAPNCDWKYSVLANCVGWKVASGEGIDVTEDWIGYRGWGNFAPEPDKNDPSKKWNRIQVYIVDDKRRIEPRVEDNVSFE